MQHIAVVAPLPERNQLAREICEPRAFARLGDEEKAFANHVPVSR